MFVKIWVPAPTLHKVSVVAPTSNTSIRVEDTGRSGRASAQGGAGQVLPTSHRPSAEELPSSEWPVGRTTGSFLDS